MPLPLQNPKITLLDADTLGDADLAPLRLAGELTAYPISAPGEVGARLRARIVRSRTRRSSARRRWRKPRTCG
ncbi:MAG: hypothetical protein R3F11_23680 [Verrucomicrobiales bacterium]